eukprot:g1142.t1
MSSFTRQYFPPNHGSSKALGTRHFRATRLYAWWWFRRRRSRKNKKVKEIPDPVIPEVETTEVEEMEVEIEPEPEPEIKEVQVQYEQVPVTPSWRENLTPKNIGATMFTSAFLAFCIYLLYLIFFKDRKEIMEQIELDLNSVMSHLRQLKQMRNEPEMTDAEVLRVRSFLLSLIISSKKEDPVKTINTALRLIGSKHLSQIEKTSLLNTTQMQSPFFNKSGTKSSIPDIGNIQKQTVELDPAAESSDDDQPWWNRLPYICVLRLKKTEALFMTNLGSNEAPKYAIVGFEDPEEGLIAGRIPSRHQWWGKPSQMRKEGIHPSRPLEDEKHFDLTWISPNELQVLINQCGCYTVVIPAGTLRTGVHGQPVTSREVLPKINEIAISDEFSCQAGTQEEVEEQQEQPSIVDSIQEQIPVNGFHPDAHDETKEVKKEEEEVVNENSGSKVEVSGDEEESVEPWWMELPRLIIPKLKKENEEGGNVEMNISALPTEEDFRPVLFEDEKDAKYFLGLLGKLTGPNTLVKVISESPEKFLKHNPTLDKSKIIVLCKGALLLDRNADKEGLRKAVRVAHTATELKMTGSDYSERLDESSLEGRIHKVAEEVVAKFQQRMKLNENGDFTQGDENYIDPVAGLLHDLDSGGLDAIFGEAQESKEKKFGFSDNAGQKDGLYDEFVNRISAEISKQTDKIQPSTGVTNTEDSSSSEVELEADLDALVNDFPPLVKQEEPEEEAVSVVYPTEVYNGVRKGSHWFLSLEVVFMPQYLTIKGESTFLAISSPDLNRKLMIGFQDQREAQFCKELMKQWANDDEETIASSVVPMDPATLLH